MFHRIEDWQQLPASRYFVLAERLVYYEGAVRGAIMREKVMREQEDAQPQPAGQLYTAPPTAQQLAQQQTGDPGPGHTTSIASDALPTYSGEALQAMTDDGGLGLPGIEYDGS